MTTAVVPNARPMLLENEEEWMLELDGLGLPTGEFVLSRTGAQTLQTALCQLPVWKSPGCFWGYNQSKESSLINCELPQAGDVYTALISRDAKALEVIADIMSDPRCWDVDRRYE